jgi:dinuclear metal center YbgI/SA1388 family protein
VRSVRVGDVQRWMEELAPLRLAEQWDNVGLQIGEQAAPVSQVLVCLGVNQAVVDQALQADVQLVVAHHPLIFTPLRTLRADDAHESLIMRIVRERLSVYVAHTNLDATPGGLGDWAAQACGLDSGQPLVPLDRQVPGAGYGRVGKLRDPVDFERLTGALCQKLGVGRVRVSGAPPPCVERMAVVNGSGASYLAQAKAAGVDVYVTGDMKHHDAVYAEALGLCVLDPGHFATERMVAPQLAKYLEERARTEGQACKFHVAHEADPVSCMP